MKPKIVVVGSSNTDMILTASHLPLPGETILGRNFLVARGGKGANQAVAAARLGAEVTLIARLGRDNFGHEAMEAYRSEGLNTAYIVWDDAEPSGVALITVDLQGENTIAVAPGANACLTPDDVKMAESVIKQANCVLLQLEIPLEAVEATIDLAHKFGTHVVLNPAPAIQMPVDLLKKVDTLSPNETEAAILTKDYASTDINDVARLLHKNSGVRNVVITLGANGALVCDKYVTTIPAYAVKAIDSTGAGDAFNGGLAVALSRGENIVDAVRYANAVGALCTTRPGAQTSMPYASEVDGFLEAMEKQY